MAWIHVAEADGALEVDETDGELELVGRLVERDVMECADADADDYCRRVVANLRTSPEWFGCLVVVQNVRGDILASEII
jgi:hypothetical protein